MKNKLFRSAFTLCVAAMILLLPESVKAQNDVMISYDFNASCAAPPAGWSIQNVDGGCTWRCGGGILQNNHSSQSCSGAADDWLITPELNFDEFLNEYISLSMGSNYSGGALNVRLSTNYSGSGSPYSATWSTLASYTSGSNYTINIGSQTGKGYIAFQYTSTGNGTGQAALYAIYSMSVKGTKSIYITNPTVKNIDTAKADLGAEVVLVGAATVLERGIVWSLTANPLKGGSGVTQVNVSGTDGVFDTTVTGLPTGTRIYYKGFVTDSNKTVYTTETSFFTLSPEPLAYPLSFTATTQSKNSIKLDWTQVTDAKGYILLQRAYQAPTGVPNDATAYTNGQFIGDGQVVGVFTSNATITTTITGLVQGTRYYYTLFPYNYNLTNNETRNYKTATPVPTATDSTWGYPPSYSSAVEGVAGTGVVTISSLMNDATVSDTTKGALAWRIQLKDGGSTLNDMDDLPTQITSLVLRSGAKNTVSSWSTAIQSVGLFDDSTGALIKQGSVGTNTITFSSINVVAQDNNYRPMSVRLSLRKTVLTDNSRFHFKIDSADVIVKGVIESSQTYNFSTLSDTLKNSIEVLATKLSFLTTMPTPIEAGAFITQQQVVALDTFGSRDIDYTGAISVSSIGNAIIASPRVVNAVSGLAAFDTVRFFKAMPTDTLIAMASGLINGKSSRYVVENSKRSDIAVDGSFIYPQNIQHLTYKDTGVITTTNSLEVFSLRLRDGGGSPDNDFEPTTLSALTFSVGNSYAIGKAALVANGVKIAEVTTVGSTIQFTNINLIANDNDSVRFSLHVTFKGTVTDGHRVTFTVTSATVGATGSLLAATNAGGATSSTLYNDNKIDITASRLAFVKQPVNVARGSIMYPFVTVQTLDAEGNIDNAGRGITLEANGTTFNFSALNAVGVIPTKAVAEFTKLIFDVPTTGATLIARSAGLDSAISNPFNVLLPVWFRSVKSGNWSDMSVWEQTTDFGTNWLAATDTPNYSEHGFVTISNGDTVKMNGISAAANTVDELTIEKGAVLVTPSIAPFKLAVNDAFGDDITVEGTLLHNNGQSIGGLDIAAPASIAVKRGGVIELASFGDAADWAGNANIRFDDSAVYVHNTTIANTISPAVMFPNAAANEVAIFRIAQNNTFPGSAMNANSPLVINGLLSIDNNTTLTIGGNGERSLRNGITGAGDLVIVNSAKTRITDVAQLSGTGSIQVNSAAAVFQIAASSQTELLNNKTITTTANNGIRVAGQLNGFANGFTGNAATIIESNATIITAHSQGVSGLFANTGAKTIQPANYVFNGTAVQNSGSLNGNVARTVKVSNNNGLVLTDNLTIADTLFIGAGNITTSPSNLLTINGNGVIDGYSAASYINGPVKVWVDSAETVQLPVGKAIYAPVNYTADNANTWVTLEYVGNTPNNNGFDTAKRGEGLAAVKANEYWKISTSNTVEGRIEVPFTTNSAITGVDALNIRVVSWNGTRWVSEGPARRTANANSVQSDVLNNYTVFTIGVDSACAIPAAPAFTTLNVCNGNTANLTATGNGSIRWFAAINDEKPFAIGNTVNAGVIFIDTVFYAEVKNIGCISNRVAYPVKINAIPGAPFVSGTTQLCYNQSVQLAADTNGTHNWYNDVNATTALFTGDVLTSSPLTKDTSFYVEKVVIGCPSTRTRVDVAVRAQIQSPFSVGAEVCAGTPAVVKATANEDIRWFIDGTTTIPFFTGERFNTANLFATTTYFLEAFEGACKSQRVPVTVDVLALPAAPTLTQPAVCEGSSAQVNATASGKVYWFNDNTATISADSGAVFTTPALNTSRTYYANVFDGKCYSPKASAVVTVYTIPVNAAFTAASYVATNQPTVIQTATTAQYYTWDFGTDATPQTASGVGPHNVKWASQGIKTIAMKVWNGNTAVACSTEVQKTVAVGPGLGIESVNGAQIVVYPNPISQGELNISLPAEEQAVISITDATGRLVWKGETNARETAVNVSGWAAGIYFVNISTNGYNQTVKIDKQ